MADRLSTRRFHIGIWLAVFVIINLVLVAGYLWSRGGQTTLVRVEASGNEFVAYVDGRPALRAEFPAPQEGGLVLSLADTENRIPSLPEPRGIDYVRVTDLASGDLLFEDDFSSGYDSEWVNSSGAFESESGVLGVQGEGRIVLSDRAWRDYAVDVQYKNIISATILLRAQDAGTGVSYRFHPPGHAFALVEDFDNVDIVPGGKVELKRSGTLKSLVAMTLNPYPLALALLAVGAVAVGALQFVAIPQEFLRRVRLPPSLPWLAAGALTVAAFAVTVYLMSTYVSRMPHVPDAVSYIFQAKLLASGRFSAPPPPVPEAFEFYATSFIGISDGKWASIYPFGHPLALAVGERLGAMWLIPPLLGAACVAMTFVVGRTIYGVRVGLLAALLLAASPFFMMTASNFMSHNTAAFYILGALLFLALGDKRPVLFGLVAGLFFGLLFNTRPLTAVVLVPPFGVMLLSSLLSRERRRPALQRLCAFVAGGLLMVVAYFVYNYGTTGDPFTNGYQASADLTETVGFGGAHSVTVGIQNEKTQLEFLVLVLNGWPSYVGLMFVLLPLIFPSRNRWDWFLMVSTVLVMGCYTLFEGEGIMHGPRYWYEAVPFLMLLAARGADRAAEVLACAAGSARRALGGGEGRPLWAGVLVVYALVFALVGSGVYGWLLGREEGWQDIFVPERPESLEGLYGVDDRLVRLVDETELDNALVLVEPCDLSWNWGCYGSVFWLNSPTLDGDVVFAKDLKKHREEILRAFPGREVYIATYRTPSLVPLSGEAAPSEDKLSPDD